MKRWRISNDSADSERVCALLAENATPDTKAALDGLRADFAARGISQPRPLFPLSIEQSLGLVLLLFVPAFALSFFSAWYFDKVPKGKIVIQLSTKPFEKAGGHAVISRQSEMLDALDAEGDDPNVAGDTRSPAIVHEDGKPLGPGHKTFAEIRDLGAGRFSHLKGFGLIFSSSDNSDPNTNGRTYWIVVRD